MRTRLVDLLKFVMVFGFAVCVVPCEASGQNGQTETPMIRHALGWQDATESGNRLLFLNNLDSADFSAGGNFTYRLGSYVVPNQSLVDYLAAPQVQKQIEFSNEQKKQLGELRQKLAAGVREISDKYGHRNDQNIASELRQQFTGQYNDALKEYRKKIEEQVRESLVPQQLLLIKQLRFKQSVQAYGLAHTLTKAPFSSQLKTSKEQAQAIQKIRQEAEAEIQKKIVEIRNAAKSRMLKELDRRQREKIKELEGESHDKKSTRL